MEALVSVEWLNDHLHDENLVILYALLKGNRGELNQSLIPGSRCFDIKHLFSDTSSQFPNTFPLPEQFEAEAQKLGINKESKIVVYDHKGIYESPRVWWLFKAMGHEGIAVLDGGLPEWNKNAFDTSNFEAYSGIEGNFKSTLKNSKIKYFDQMEAILSSDQYCVLDARSAGRFDGSAPEPRKGLKSGHMEGARSLPYTEVLENGKYKAPEDLKKVFAKYNLGGKELVFTCGSGITACVILLASELISENRKSVYDGSWTEWALVKGLTEEVN